MNIRKVHHTQLYIQALKAMHPVETVLDIGCGIVPQRHIINKIHVLCEPYIEYVEVLLQKIARKGMRQYGAHVVLNMGWGEANKYFPRDSVDTVVLVDVIEHLEKEEGRRLLSETIEIAKRQVILFTPLGFMPQYHEDGKDAWGLNGADWQEHKSGWMPEDFTGDGWTFFVSEEYHFYDNLGRKLDKPYGAFWAILTKCSDSSGYYVRAKKYFNILRVKWDGAFIIRVARKVKRAIGL